MPPIPRPHKSPPAGMEGWPGDRRLAAFALGTVLGASLLAVRDALGIEDAADDMVAHARQVADPAATDQHDGVLLEVVPFTGDVSGDLHAIGEAHAGDLAQRRVGLLGRHGFHLEADAALLWAAVQGGVLWLAVLLAP